MDVAQLILDIKFNAQIVGKVSLLARESMSGVWYSDNTLVS
jgi:hypothetical protein